MKGDFMESKVKAIKIGSIIASISLVCLCIIGFLMKNGNLKNILFTVFSGVFTSSFVTVFIYATEYGVVKKEAMVEYWDASYKVNQMILQIPFLMFDEPKELIKEYFAELWHNENVQNLLQQLPEDCNVEEWGNTLKIKREAENQLVEYIRPQYNYLDVGQQENEEIIRNSLKNKMRMYEEKIEAVMRQYIKIADTSYQACENAYGRMYFFKGQKFRKNVYDMIHEPLRATLRKIKNRAYCNFKQYLDKTAYNLPVMIEFINELQNEIFEIEYVCVDEEKGYHLVKTAKNKNFFEMDKRIEDFRTEIYHCEPEYNKEFYSFARWVKAIDD